MKVIRDPENWERTGLYRLAIEIVHYPVWTQAFAGPGLPELLGKRKSHRKIPDPGWCFADWFVGSCFGMSAGLLFDRVTGSDADSGYRRDVTT